MQVRGACSRGTLRCTGGAQQGLVGGWVRPRLSAHASEERTARRGHGRRTPGGHAPPPPTAITPITHRRTHAPAPFQQHLQHRLQVNPIRLTQQHAGSEPLLGRQQAVVSPTAVHWYLLVYIHAHRIMCCCTRVVVYACAGGRQAASASSGATSSAPTWPRWWRTSAASRSCRRCRCGCRGSCCWARRACTPARWVRRCVGLGDD